MEFYENQLTSEWERLSPHTYKEESCEVECNRTLGQATVSGLEYFTYKHSVVLKTQCKDNCHKMKDRIFGLKRHKNREVPF